MKKHNLKKYAENKSELYYKKIWIQSIVVGIPWIGGSLDKILSYKGRQLAEERIKTMLRFLKEEIQKIENNKIEMSFLESEEWNDIVFLSMEKSARIRNKGRLKTIARILKGSIKNEIDTGGHVEDLIDVVAELRDEEAILLREMYKFSHEINTEPARSIVNYAEELKDRIPKTLHNRMDFLLKRIEGLGLISESTGGIVNYLGGTYDMTSTGIELCKYMIDKDEDLNSTNP